MPGIDAVDEQAEVDATFAECNLGWEFEYALAEERTGPQSMGAAVDEAAGGVKEIGNVEGMESAGLVGPEGVEGDARGENVPPPVVRLGSGREREPDLERGVQLAEVSFGIASATASLEELESVLPLRPCVGEEEEVIDEEFTLLTGALEDHEDYAARGLPTPGLVAQVVEPGVPLLSWPARWPLQVRLGQLMELLVAPKPDQLTEAFGLEGPQESRLGEAGIHPKPDFKLVPGQLLKDRHNEGQPAIDGVRLTLPKLSHEEVSVRQAGHKGLVAAQALVPVVSRTRPVPVDLDGERVHVHYGLGMPRTFAQPEPPLRQLPLGAAPKRIPIGVLGQRGKEPEECPLAREPVRNSSVSSLPYRGSSTTRRDGKPQHRIVPKKRCVAVIRKRLRPQQQIHQRELSKRVPDPVRVPLAVGPLSKHLAVGHDFRQLPQQKSPHVPAQTLISGLQSDAAVEIRLKARTLFFTRGASSGAVAGRSLGRFQPTAAHQYALWAFLNPSISPSRAW